jgi:hypothetical protein
VVIDPLAKDDPDGEESAFIAEILFAHPPTYPETGPSWKLRAVRGLSDADVAAGSRAVAEQVESSVGGPCIYDLVTVAEEWLRGGSTSFWLLFSFT